MESQAPTKAITATTTITSTSKYVRDFESLFCPVREDELRDKARGGQLRDSQFRSLCWRYFLHCLPKHQDQWLESCRQSRLNYEQIKAKHLSAKQMDDDKQSPQRQTSESSTPLSVDQSSEENSSDKDNHDARVNNKDNKEDIEEEEQQYIKATSQCDHKNVFRTIERDVVRTFPDMEFFRQTDMQNILENVLFNFASENPRLSYKQGMHELLAILLYVLHTDSQTCLITYEGGYANDSIAVLLDRNYLEHDVFHLFCALMKSIESWYQNDEILTVPESNTDSRSGNKTASRPQVGSVLGIKLNMISENIVKNYDIELFNHLDALQIAPQIYGIRWMRLLFGREFEILDLLTVWDAIICDSVSMSLTEYVFASMLLTLREELINGDYTDCLNNLMRHQFKDVQYVIKLALHLRDPKNCPRPKPNYSITHKHYGQALSTTAQHNRFSPKTSLTSKLSQQYISGGNQQFQQMNRSNHNYSSASASQLSQSDLTTRRYSHNLNPLNIDNRDSRKMFMTPKPQSSIGKRPQTNSIAGPTSSGIRFLNPSNRSSGPNSTSSTNKFLPNINKFVSSIGQNIQDKIDQPLQSASQGKARNQQRSSSSQGVPMSGRSHQQYHHRSGDQLLLTANPVKEYEMREMLSSSSLSGLAQRSNVSKFPIGSIGAKGALNLSTESYDDLHSIVDYCWRLLSEQIDSLQRCLPKEKSLHSEDEIFVALAQLKKVRDVLKGSLRLEDELDSPPGANKA